MTDPIAASDIAAQAFRFMELAPISSFADDSPQANAALDMYPSARDVILAEYDWSIARKLVDLPPLSDSSLVEDPDLLYTFKLPSDALVVRHVYSDKAFRQDGRILRSAQSTALKVRYTYRVAREKDLPALLRLVMALQLALLLAPKYVGSRSKRESLQNQLDSAIEKAIGQDAQTASPVVMDLGQPDLTFTDWAGASLL